MRENPITRREFLAAAAGAMAAGATIPYVFTADAEERAKPKSKNDRFRIGAIGMRYQGTVIADKAPAYGDVVAICDVDRQIAEKARGQFRRQGRALRRLPQDARPARTSTS